jgi:hypothetical protein
MMEYEYIDDLAEELRSEVDALRKVIDQLGIKTLQMAVPPSGVKVTTVVYYRDAEWLRAYIAAKPDAAFRS